MHKRFKQTFEGSNLRVLNVTFKIFIHTNGVCWYPYMSNQNGEFVIVGCTRLLCVCPMALLLEIIRRKHFAGNFSACIDKYLCIAKVNLCRKKHSLKL